MDLTKKSSYNYDLPKHLIAQHPLQKRDECRLLYLPKSSDDVIHHHFRDIISLLKPDDVLVINTSKVIPARLFGKKVTGAKIEVLLLRETVAEKKNSSEYGKTSRWECLVKPANKLRCDDEIMFTDNNDNRLLKGKVVSCAANGIREIDFLPEKAFNQNKDNLNKTNQSRDGLNVFRPSWSGEECSTEDWFLSVIDQIGKVPLPPYIKRDYSVKSDDAYTSEDKEYYQTVYADIPGSAAAPTAGMHFSQELLAEIASKGIKIAPLILHIGIDTFRPVKVENILEHKMHREFCTITDETAHIINEAKQNGQRIIAVGTTVTRTLESFANRDNRLPLLSSGSKWSELFIYPGYEYKIIDGMLTNFHLPESTLLMMIAAFAGYERIMKAYLEAVAKEYRFFSYGDAMLML